MAASDRQGMINVLVRLMADRKIDTAQAMQALSSLADSSLPPASINDLAQYLTGSEEPALDPLRGQLRQARMTQALQFHSLKNKNESIPEDLKSDLSDLPLDAPLTWTTREESFSALGNALSALSDRRFIETRRDTRPQVAEAVNNAFSAAVKTASNSPSIWDAIPIRSLIRLVEHRSDCGDRLKTLLNELAGTIEKNEQAQRQLVDKHLESEGVALPAGIDEIVLLQTAAERFKSADSFEERRRLLDMVACWPTDLMALVLGSMCTSVWAQDHAALILAMRFGEPYLCDWSKWQSYLANHNRFFDQKLQSFGDPLVKRPEDLLFIWCSGRENSSPELMQLLDTLGRQSGLAAINPDDFVARWQIVLSADDADSIVNQGPPPLPLSVTQAHGTAPAPAVSPHVTAQQPLPVHEPAPRPSPPNAPAVAPQSRPKPVSKWRPKVRAFFHENWHLAAGLIMMLVGCSVLAYYTWDKHWLVRHTLIPGLLIAITFGLARAASSLEKMSRELAGTATVLRGAAIALLPANFMIATRLLDDPQVPAKAVITALVILAYTIAFGWALARWCSAVHGSLGRTMGIPLLLLNLLAILRPVGISVMPTLPDLQRLIESGFYIGFILVAVSTLRFTTSDAFTAETVREKRLPWFYGIAMILTFLEVFAWCYGSLRMLPRPMAYAPMTVLAAGLVLRFEQRSQSQLGIAREFGTESFVGFALIIAGVLMSVRVPYVRSFTIFLAAFVWLNHAWAKKHYVHETVGVILLSAAFTSCIALPGFPARWVPATGLVAAIALEILSRIAARSGRSSMQKVSIVVQVLWLMFTVAAALWRPWVQHAGASFTGIYLAMSALGFAYRAYRDESSRWIHMAAIIVAVSTAFIDTSHVPILLPLWLAGLSFIWLALTSVLKRPYLLETRSTVPSLYGILTLGVMLFRITDVNVFPGGQALYLDLIAIAGPVLMAAALIPASLRSRSALPAYIGTAILISLWIVPAPVFLNLFPMIRPGSGLLTALLALLSVCSCFMLRAKFTLASTGTPDPFLGGGAFPLLRDGHQLFSRPALFLALFLTIQTETWTFAENLFRKMYDHQTGLALLVTAATWTLLGIYNRRNSVLAAIGAHLGWIWLFLSLFVTELLLSAKPNWSIPVLATLVVLQCLYFLYSVLGRRDTLMLKFMTIMGQVLSIASLVLVLVAAFGLADGTSVGKVAALLGFLAVQQVWHGIRTGNRIYGAFFFLLAWVTWLSWDAPGVAPLLLRHTPTTLISSTLTVIVFALTAATILEVKAWRQALHPFVVPQIIFAGLLTCVITLLCIIPPFAISSLSSLRQMMLLAALVLSARCLASGLIALLVFLTAYLTIHIGPLHLPGVVPGGLYTIFIPWHMSILALIMGFSAAIGDYANQRLPQLFAGSFAPTFMKRRGALWIDGTAVAIAIIAPIVMALDPALRLAPVQVWTPAVSGAALLFTGWRRRIPAVLTAAVVIIIGGNVQAVHALAGPWLRAKGLTDLHLTNLGLLLCLFEAGMAKLLLRKESVTTYLNRVSLILAGSILGLIVTIYFAYADVSLLTTLRLAVSGVTAYVAAMFFRHIARQQPTGEQANVIASMYHFGVTLALWCAALMVPALRAPGTALWALAVPLFYFYARAEIGAMLATPVNRLYCSSATVVGFLVLFLYAFRAAFCMVFFPAESIPLLHYHYHAPLVIIVGILLLRLRGLGGNTWLTLYGGIAIITGSYFSLTYWPGLSPFTHPDAGAWCALGWAQFWILVSYQRSPIRTMILRICALDVREWLSARHGWGVFILVATHAAIAWAVVSGVATNQTTMIAPLVLGAASVFMHMAYLRKSLAYLILGWIEIALAVHMDFFVHSTLTANDVIWVILGLWAALLAVQALLPGLFRARAMNTLAWFIGTFVLLHMFYHGPASVTGLTAVLAWGFFTAMTPARESAPDAPLQRMPSRLLIWIPTWITFFSQAKSADPHIFYEMPGIWQMQMSALAILITGFAAEFLEGRLNAGARVEMPQHRILDETIAWLRTSGGIVRIWALIVASVILCPLCLMQAAGQIQINESALLALLCAISAAGWFAEAWKRNSLASAILGSLFIPGVAASLRAVAMLLMPMQWRLEFDVGICLGVSGVFLLANQLVSKRQPQMKRAFTGALLVLPAATLLWAALAGWGLDPAMLVVSVHSLMWVWIGKDDRHSPFNGLAVGGFVSVILMLFWGHLALKVLNAYVIPVGLGVLILLQLFRDRVSAGTRNRVRTAVLFAMLGSTGYPILIQTHHSLAFHLIMLVLSLAVMSAGAWLSVRVYLYLGFAGVLLDLSSIVYQTFVEMDRGLKMTVIGLVVLLLGAAFVIGAVYFKTHRAAIRDKLNSWRQFFGDWE